MFTKKHLARLDEIHTTAHSLLKYVVAAILLAVPLYPKFPLFRIPGVPVSIRLEDAVIAVGFIVYILAVLPNIKKIVASTYFKGAILFFAIGLLGVLSGIFITETVVPHVGFLHWARRIEYISVFFMGYASIRKPKDVYFYIKLLFVVIVIAFFYGVGQKYFNVPIITTQNEDYARGVALRYRPEAHLVSTFAGHYDLASFLILTLPLLYLFITSPNETLKRLIPDTKPLLSRAGIVLVSAMGLWLLMQTASRISIVSYLGSACLALILVNRKKFIPLVIVVSFVFALFSTNLVARYLNIITVYATEEVVEESVVVEDRSTSIRLDVEWPRAIRALQKNPLTGTGYSSITLATDNGYLRMLGETGVMGFIAFFTFLGSIILIIFNSVINKINSTPEYQFKIAVIASLFGVFLNMVFIDILEASKFALLFWLIMGFAAGLSTKYAKKHFR